MKSQALLHAWSNSSTLAKALLLSITLHAMLLTIKFVSPDAFELKNIDSPLEVVLVNAKSKSRPKKADVIAQANVDGGGESEKQRASSPLPPKITDVDGDLIRQAEKQVELLQTQQRQLLQQLKPSSMHSSVLNPKAGTERMKSDLNGRDNNTTQTEIARREAEINRNIVHESKRPKRAYLTAINAQEGVFAIYYDRARRKIEALGTDRFPKDSQGKPLYGSLVLVIIVNRSGHLGYNQDGWKVKSVEIASSSGNPELDRQAVSIVRAAAPFGPFDAELRKQYDILEIISTFKFSREGLETMSRAP